MLRVYEYGKLTASERGALLERFTSEEESDVDQVVSDIVTRVERHGVDAVREYTKRFDGVEVQELLATEEEFARAEARLSSEAKDAFGQAAANIRAFHELQLEGLKDRAATIDGSRLGYRYVPVEGAAVYAPGGTALYPSSVLMGLIPAALAGVEQPLLITPPDPSGSVHDAILFCARLAGAGAVLKAGGAQGIAAAAFGLVGPRASLVIGPGNRFVAGAKALLAKRGLLRMDLPAGPSEVLVIADSSARADFVAADLLSQAEHGADSAAVLCTDSPELARATVAEVERGLSERPLRAEMKTRAIRERSFVLIFDDLADAFAFSNDYAPEHLELCTRNPEKDLESVRSAGSVFLGHYAPVALGDYYSGTNHVLPTAGAARFYSGLGVDVFLKRISYQHPTQASLRRALDPILIMSKLEGLDEEHGHSVAIRFAED